MRAPRIIEPSLLTAAGTLPRGQRERLPGWELAFLLVASLNYWTDLLRVMFPGTESASVAFRAIQFTFYGGFALLILRDLASLRETLRRIPLLIALLLLPSISYFWSVNPGESLTRSIALLGSCLYGVYVAGQIAPRLALRVLAWTGGIAAAISLMLILAFPSVGLMSEGEYVNVWSGAFIHKNGLGQMTALGAIISLIVLMSDGLRNNRLIAVGLVLNLVLLAGCRSLTSQLVFVASVVLVLTIGRFVRFVARNAVVIVLMLAPPLLIAATNLSIDTALTVLEAFGKNATMSSRLPLWHLLVDFIQERPWLGWGYEAFFTDENFAYRTIEAKLHFKPYYAHNGYVEIWIALGATGFGLLVAVFLRFAWLAARRLYTADRDPLYLLCFVYVFAFLIQNTAEATILQRNSMSWALFVLLYAFLARASATAAIAKLSHSETRPHSANLLPSSPRRIEIA